MLSPVGSPVNGLPPRISSPSSLTTGSDMLRSMLLNESPRQRSGSGTSSTMSSGKSMRSPRGGKRSRGSRSSSPRARSIGESPLPPLSPASSMELQVGSK